MKSKWKFLLFALIFIFFYILIEYIIDKNLFPQSSNPSIYTAFVIFLIMRLLIFFSILYALYNIFLKRKEEKSIS
jgi:hypothetical protein